jgi:anionic cell wall polymer biosynthesis LytR-Cps2A-Psr (LCP) family protein
LSIKGKDHEKFTIKGGKSNYNGEEALNYTRYREDSDFNRTKRQQVFIDVVANKMLSISQIGNIPELLDIMGDNFKTNIQPSMIIRSGQEVHGRQRYGYLQLHCDGRRRREWTACITILWMKKISMKLSF